MLSAGPDRSPHLDLQPPERPVKLLSLDFTLLMLTGALSATAVNLLLPVLPLTVTRVTGETAAAGVVSAPMAAATIVFELQSAALVRRFQERTLLIAALLVQALAMVGFAQLRVLPAMLVFGVLAGAGFGLAMTISADAIRGLAPGARQGEAIGYYGLSASAPTIFAPPLALLLLDRVGVGAVFVLGAAACAAGALTAMQLRRVQQRVLGAQPGHGVLATLATPGVLLIGLSFVCASVTYGAAVSFSPLLLGTRGLGSAPVFLLVFGVARTVTRVFSGRFIDRFGDLRLALPGLAAGALALAMLPQGRGLLALTAAALFGAAFGVVQTGAFVGMLRAAGAARAANVSGIWNMAVDVGFGGGTLLLAPIAAAVGFARMFWLLPVLFGLAFALRLAAPRGAVRRLSA